MEKCAIIRANLHCHLSLVHSLCSDWRPERICAIKNSGSIQSWDNCEGRRRGQHGRGGISISSKHHIKILIPLIVDPIINQYTRRTPCCCALLWYKVLTPSSLGKPVSAFLAALVWATSAAAAGLWLVESVSRDLCARLWLAGWCQEPGHCVEPSHVARPHTPLGTRHQCLLSSVDNRA